jgi:hypothetical protein
MKKLLFLFLAIPFAGFAQKPSLPIDTPSNSVSFNEVVKVEGVSKDDLYLRAREWFAKSFRSSKDVIQMDDKASGKIIGKGGAKGTYSQLLFTGPLYVEYTITIVVKDGRYRYEISDFGYYPPANNYSYRQNREDFNTIYANPKTYNGKSEVKGGYKDVFAKVSSLGADLSSSIKAAMASAPTGVKSKDDF